MALVAPSDAAEAATALGLEGIWSRLLDGSPQRGSRRIQPTWLEAVSAALLGREETEALGLRLIEQRDDAARARSEERDRVAAARAETLENLQRVIDDLAVRLQKERDAVEKAHKEAYDAAAPARREEAERVAAAKAKQLEGIERWLEGSGVNIKMDSWGRALYYKTPGHWLSYEAAADYVREARRKRERGETG